MNDSQVPESPQDESLEGKSPEDKSPEDKSPEDKSPEGKSPEDKSPEGKSPEDKSPEDKSPEDKSPEDKVHWDELVDLLGAEPADEILAAPPEPADVPERPMKRKPSGAGPKRPKRETSPHHWNSVLGELGLEADELPDFEPLQDQEEEPIQAESSSVSEPETASQEADTPAWNLDPPKSLWANDEPRESAAEETNIREDNESARGAPRGRGRHRDRDDEGSSRGRRRRGGRRRREERTEADRAERDAQDSDESVANSLEDDDRTGTDRDATQRTETGRDDAEGGSRDRSRRRGGRGRGDRDRSRRGRRPRSEETASTVEDDELDQALNEFEVEADVIFENDVDIAPDEESERKPSGGRRPRSSRQVPSWQEAIQIIVDSNLAARNERDGGSRGGRRRRPPRDRRD